MSKETFAGKPLDPHAADDEIDRLRGEVERLTQHNADLVRANQHSMDWFNDALARAEAAEKAISDARFKHTPHDLALVQDWLDAKGYSGEALTVMDAMDRIALLTRERDDAKHHAEARLTALREVEGELREANEMLLNQARTIRERDEALHDHAAAMRASLQMKERAEAAERERDEYKHSAVTWEAAAESLQAKVAKLREALKDLLFDVDCMIEHDIITDVRSDVLYDRARAVLQETEQ